MPSKSLKKEGTPFFEECRTKFHAALLNGVLSESNGIPSNADRGSRTSIAIAKSILLQLGKSVEKTKLSGQSSGSEFERACKDFLQWTFPRLNALRPGRWRFLPEVGVPMSIEGCEQFSHLLELENATKGNPSLRAVLGNDYTIKPDVLLVRDPEEDEWINQHESLVGTGISQHTSLREANNKLPILHASISCKWTLRSDRAQNARTEALNLIRNRKGRVPHIVVVTGEPLPGRLASITLGTGDIDCVYHFALRELEKAIQEEGSDDSRELLSTMVGGKRLKDISDLPMDLAI